MEEEGQTISKLVNLFLVILGISILIFVIVYALTKLLK